MKFGYEKCIEMKKKTPTLSEQLNIVEAGTKLTPHKV